MIMVMVVIKAVIMMKVTVKLNLDQCTVTYILYTSFFSFIHKTEEYCSQSKEQVECDFTILVVTLLNVTSLSTQFCLHFPKFLGAWRVPPLEGL